jgi:sarcosine oxidase
VTADVIVVGLGVMGSATVDALARRGHSVVGIERHRPGHSLGSSHGPTRIIRRSIEEGPAYVPIVLDAFERWRELQDDAGRPIIELNGVIRIAPVGSPLHAAFAASASAWDLPYEVLDAAAVMDRFPGFAVPDGYEGVFEQGAGIIHASAALQALHDRARRAGARLHFEEPVLTWTADDAGVTVTTPAGSFAAAALVFTAGAWTSALLESLALPLVPHRVVNVSFWPLVPELFGGDRFPAFILADDQTLFYGVPTVRGEGLKVGGGGAPSDPDRVERVVTEREVAALREAVDRFVPNASGPVASTLTCLYTVAPDGHFVIDRHPAHGNVVIASPCSGHGFKFASAIGPLLADLATVGATRFDLDGFRLDRFTGTAMLAPGLDLAGGRLADTDAPH